MSECVRQATPVEVLKHDLALFFNNKSVLDVEMGQHLDEILAKAMCYESDYYNNQYVVIKDMLEEAKRENNILKTQNRVLTEYISMKGL